LGDDPTVTRLEETAAEFLGKESALFVPSGTMANQIALHIHCQPGDEVVIGSGAHLLRSEGGAGSAFANVQLTIAGRGGVYTAQDLEAVFKTHEMGGGATRLACVENTHNYAGGAVWSQNDIVEIATFMHGKGLPFHLDGARLCNAAAALGRTARELAAPFTTATLCFSKGLGAPVGSVVAGPKALMAKGARVRKMLGGGMRQSGILAAAALYALEHNVARLGDDHANARFLAERLAQVRALTLKLEDVQTNIIFVDLGEKLPLAPVFAASLRKRGVLALVSTPRRLRLVTHLDVDRSACERAAAIIAELCR
jgi:threonine aldolase